MIKFYIKPFIKSTIKSWINKFINNNMWFSFKKIYHVYSSLQTMKQKNKHFLTFFILNIKLIKKTKYYNSL